MGWFVVGLGSQKKSDIARPMHCLIVYAELALLITIIPNPDVISSAITSLILYERN